MNENKAIKLINNGAMAACVSGAITFIIVIVSMTEHTSIKLLAWDNVLLFLDVLFVFICAYFIYKRSRIAALVMFAYFVISKILIFLQNPDIYELFVPALFLYFFLRAIYGSFIYHNIKVAKDPKYKPAPKWVKFLVITLGVITFFGSILFIIYRDYTLPSKYVLTGKEIKAYHKEKLIENSIINESDKVKYFYSIGMKSILEGGSILTDDRVISYKMVDEKIEINQLNITQITDIEQGYVGNVVIPSKYRIKSIDPDKYIDIDVGAEQRGDIKFIGLLRAKVEYEKLK